MKTSVLFIFSAVFVVSIAKEIIILTESKEKVYNFFPLTKDYLEFKVKARTDIHIALTPSHVFDEIYYEIVFGGWHNTKSVIRKNGEDVAEYKSPIIDQDVFATYWVRKNDTEGSIEVGKGKATKPIMRIVDSQYMKMNFFGIATGFKSEGVWAIDSGIFCNMPDIDVRIKL